jgi:hypothetical protein
VSLGVDRVSEESSMMATGERRPFSLASLELAPPRHAARHTKGIEEKKKKAFLSRPGQAPSSTWGVCAKERGKHPL